MKRLAKAVHFMMKLKKCTLHSGSRIEPNLGEADEWAPYDVKEGHFAVLAGSGEKKRRFVVCLNHLSNPEFLRLLDQAKEEYGFSHGGLLSVPCSSEELKRILGN